LYWQFGRAKAVRAGRWKLVSLGNSGWELYDLEKDRTELHNLASQHPERVAQMTALWEAWWKTCRT
jgi:arylsulfatase